MKCCITVSARRGGRILRTKGLRLAQAIQA